MATAIYGAALAVVTVGVVLRAAGVVGAFVRTFLALAFRSPGALLVAALYVIPV